MLLYVVVSILFLRKVNIIIITIYSPPYTRCTCTYSVHSTQSNKANISLSTLKIQTRIMYGHRTSKQFLIKTHNVYEVLKLEM